MKKPDYKEIDQNKLSDAVNGETHHYPSILNLDEGDLPEVKNWKVGKTYRVELVIKEVTSTVGEHNTISPMDDSDKNKVHCKFEVISASVDNDADEKKEYATK